MFCKTPNWSASSQSNYTFDINHFILFSNDSRIEIQKNYFEQKGLTLHSASPLPSHPTELELTVSVNEEAPNSSDTVNHPEVVLSLYTYHPIKVRSSATEDVSLLERCPRVVCTGFNGVGT